MDPAFYNRRMPISPIPELVAELAAGRMVVLVDEEDRENEGDIVIAADHVTPEAINFMARFARGLICLTLTRERCERLQLLPMASRNGTKHGTAFTVSIEAATGVTTGISAADRARTVQVAVARDAKPSDLVQPGHIFPLQAQDGGVHLALSHGQWEPTAEVLVRVHEPFTALDLLNASESHHSWPLPQALAALKAAPAGVAVLLNCTQEPDALLEQLVPRSTSTQPHRAQMDLRTYGVGAQILRELGVARMKLLGSPRRMPSMTGYGLEVTGFQPVAR